MGGITSKIPCLPYPGGKGRLAKTIIDVAPKSGRIYVEPFVGLANVFWTAANRCSFQEWWLNDFATMPFFQAVLSVGKDIVVPPRSKQLYYEMRDAAEKGDPVGVVLEPYLSFSGGGYRNGGPGWSAKSQSAETYQRKVRDCYTILTVTKPYLTSLDWVAMDWRALGPDDFVYLDPPYLECDVRAYDNDTVNHRTMVEMLLQAKFKWVLSEYPHPLYLSTLGEPFWRKDVQLVVKDRKRHNEERRVECLWKNY